MVVGGKEREITLGTVELTIFYIIKQFWEFYKNFKTIFLRL